MDEVCQDCIWWLGDSSGELGECTNGDSNNKIMVGRYESCVDYMARELSFENIGTKVDELDFD